MFPIVEVVGSGKTIAQTVVVSASGDAGSGQMSEVGSSHWKSGECAGHPNSRHPVHFFSSGLCSPVGSVDSQSDMGHSV